MGSFSNYSCPNGEDMKTIHSGLLSTGTAKEVLSHTNRGKAIGSKNGIAGVPALLLLDCNDDLIGEIYSAEELDPIS